MSWGDGAVDPARGMLIVNADYMPFMTILIPRPKDSGDSTAPVAQDAPIGRSVFQACPTSIDRV
jgi:hypothetical protein